MCFLSCVSVLAGRGRLWPRGFEGVEGVISAGIDNEAENKSLGSDPTDPFKGENGELENTLYMCDLRQRHHSQLRMSSHYPEETLLVRM